jgi:hypothetical protein
MKTLIATFGATAALVAAGCGNTTTSHSTSHHKVQPVAAVTTTATVTQTQTQTPAACQILKGDWDRARAHLKNNQFAYVGGAWFDIAKDFQALGMQQDYNASKAVASIFIDIAEGQIPTSHQTDEITAAIKQLNADGSTACGSL